MPRVYVNVEGWKEVSQQLSQMGEKGKDLLHEAVNKGAEYLQPIIKNNIKLGNDNDNTHLRDTVRQSKAKRKKSTKQTALVNIGGIKNVEYPMHLETGHMTEEKKHIPARPYIRSAVDQNAGKTADIVVDHLLNRLGL
jgi:hypothetical protein